MSFRLRLTLSVAAAVALAVATACAIAYVVVGRQMYGQVDSSLRLEEPRLAAALTGLPSAPPKGTRLPPVFSGSETYFWQVVTASGSILYRPSYYRGALPITQTALGAARRRSPLVISDMTVQGVHLRVATITVAPGYALQIARRLSDADTVLSQLRTWFLLVAIGGVALAAFLGAFVARSALRPVRRLTDAAEHVAETHDLSRRIDATGSDELSRLAGSFNTMLAALEQSVAAQRQLVADASHELRTPLTSLRTNFEVLMRPGGLPDESRRKLEHDVLRQFEEMSALVADIVELARDGPSTAEEDDVRLDVLVADAVERAERNTPTVRFKLESTPSLVHGVPGRLDRAVTNLLDNAAKWSPAGELVEVNVADGTVTVRDHGPGIADADLPFIFDRFYRSAEARSMRGSGLGLAIVRQVAEAHGGHVTVERPPDGGTRFVLTVPALPVPSEDLVDV
jgi:two-component system sensor histidine kinase MprB